MESSERRRSPSCTAKKTKETQTSKQGILKCIVAFDAQIYEHGIDVPLLDHTKNIIMTLNGELLAHQISKRFRNDAQVRGIKFSKIKKSTNKI